MFNLFNNFPEKNARPLPETEQREIYEKDKRRIYKHLEKVQKCEYEPNPHDDKYQLKADQLGIALQKVFLETLLEYVSLCDEDNPEYEIERALEKLNKPCGKNDFCYDKSYHAGEAHGYLKGEEHGYYKGIRESEEYHYNKIKTDNYCTDIMINDISILLDAITEKKISELEPEQLKILNRYFKEVASRFKIKKVQDEKKQKSK